MRPHAGLHRELIVWWCTAPLVGPRIRRLASLDPHSVDPRAMDHISKAWCLFTSWRPIRCTHTSSFSTACKLQYGLSHRGGIPLTLHLLRQGGTHCTSCFQLTATSLNQPNQHPTSRTRNVISSLVGRPAGRKVPDRWLCVVLGPSRARLLVSPPFTTCPLTHMNRMPFFIGT